MNRLGLLVAIFLWLGAPTARAQVDGPAARLAVALPQLFASASVADTVVGGEQGARVGVATPAQQALGLQAGDVVLAVAGVRLGDPAATAEAIAAAVETHGTPTFTVWRTIPGVRPVVDPAVLGTQVLDRFVVLPEAERVPMRLAGMLANQQTLVVQGAGVVLLPSAETFDADLWRRDANPLPQASEAALRTVADAVRHRTRIPIASDGEGARAADLLRRGQFLEAQERARRAMVDAVEDPATRADTTALAVATRTYVEASRAYSAEQKSLVASEPTVAIVAEGLVNRIDAFLPQNTLLDVEASTGWGFATGLRVRLAFDSVPVVRDLFVLAEYGQLHNSFEDPDGGEVLATTLQQISAELLYRPRVASRLRPFVRGGVGVFPLSGRVHCSDGEFTAFTDTNVGGIFGGGVDFLAIRSWHLRSSITATYRVVHAKFSPDDAPLLFECGRNTPPDFGLGDLDNGIYEFDMDGWQVGLMLSFEL